MAATPVPEIRIRTVTGAPMNLLAPNPKDLTELVIATGLGNVCRYSGQISHFYSVAQHSLLVARLVEDRLKPLAQMHDGSEAILGDVSRHLKHSDYMWGYRKIEKKVQGTVETAFQTKIGKVTLADRQRVKNADDLAAIFEQLVLREQRPVTPEAIEEKTAEGFVRCAPEALLPMLPLLPQTVVPMEDWPNYRLSLEGDLLAPFFPWPPDFARDAFLFAWALLPDPSVG